jgi:hypothetical protein
MADQHTIRRIRRVHRTLGTDKKIIDDARELAAQSARLLRDHPKPDTFTGRKTQNPFPQGPIEEMD